MEKKALKTAIMLMVFLMAQPVMAQVQHVSGSVYRMMKGLEGKSERLAVSVPVYVFDNAKEAQRQASEYRAQTMRQGGYARIKSNDVVQPDYEGHFEADVSLGGALLVIDEGTVKVIKITNALNYDIVLSEGLAGGILLKNTDVYGERKGVALQELPPVDDGPNLHWNVTVSLPEQYTSKRSRLIFQPAVIDCQTEDTIQWLEPLVYEGAAYHLAQVRRKSYQYARNDSLSRYYVNKNLNNNRFTFQWESTYPKPDPERSYKWVSDLRLEDYTHVYYDDDTKEGTCNSRKPWKMLDIGFARKEMVLDERYYEPSKAQIRETARDLQLTFEVGKAQLTDDSVNMQTIQHLIRELRSYGRQLMNVKIQGTASPDGNMERNAELARQRAQKALSIISPYIGSAGSQTVPPVVYTWEDVADSLLRRGQPTEAAELRGHAGRNNIVGIRNMMESNPAIEQILQNLRLMKCSYTIRQNKVMEPEEALWAYYNDKSYAEGGDNKFSNGDYYHLFRQIKDSVELRKLTVRAYHELKDRGTMQYSPFAAYIANRMACYTLEEDKTDLEILAPFVDMKSSLEAQRQIAFDNEYKYTVNRKEIVANQAIMCFKAMRLEAAAHLAGKLPDTEEYRDIKRFTELETLFFKRDKTAAEQERALNALKYVMGTSRLNNAILSLELAPELGKTYAQVEPLVDALPDEEPRKWYMKGVISANRAETTEDDFMVLAAKYGVEEALKMNENEIPSFLAYMQHCFDMDSTFYGKYYTSEANISDEVKKKYPYDKKKAALYRLKFEELMQTGKTDTTAKKDEEDED